ncbi:OmpA family protein, partial [Elioraea rosea]|uniref:OmpA family protein n=1 Tax=Elioraea rosea TaxID=2492390 RepID=UPI001185A52A
VEPLAPPPPPAMPEELPARARNAEAPPAAPPAAPAPILLPIEAASPPPAAPPVSSAPLAAPVPQAAPPAPAAAMAPPSPPPPPQPVQPSVVIDRTALQPGRGRVAQPGYALSFLPGTTTIVASDRAVLASLASRGAGSTFRVTGFADEAGTGRALDLPLARARAVADALRAAGVSAEAIELGGAARPGPAGRGAEVTLITAR